MFEVSKFKDNEKQEWAQLWKNYRCGDLPLDVLEKTTESNWQRVFNDKNCHANVLRLKESHKIVGFVLYLNHWCTKSDFDECYIYELFVEPEFRSKGGGKLLIEFVAKFARDNDMAWVSWLARKANKGAQKFYNDMSEPVEWLRYKIEI